MSASPVASTTRFARIASRPDLLSVMTPRMAPPSTIGATPRRWSSGVTPASATRTSATYLNRSPSSAWLRLALGVRRPHRPCPVLELAPDAFAVDRVLVAVPAEALDADLGDVPAEAAVAIEQGRPRAGTGGAQGRPQAARAAADDEHVRLVDDVDRSGGFADPRDAGRARVAHEPGGVRRPSRRRPPPAGAPTLTAVPGASSRASVGGTSARRRARRRAARPGRGRPIPGSSPRHVGRPAVLAASRTDFGADERGHRARTGRSVEEREPRPEDLDETAPGRPAASCS